MEKQHALQQLEQLQKKLYAIHYACSAMNLDADTVAPKNTSEGRGVALGVLAGEEQQLMICPETRALLDELDRQKDELDLLHRREVEELRRRCDQLTRIPAEEYIAYSELVNKAGDVWHKAKEKDDFAMFCPLLQELVEYNRKFAAYYDSTRAPYDALLNEYERGVDTKMLDEFFATLRQTIVPLLQKIARKPQIDDSFLHNYYPVDKQKAFADDLMQVMGLDRGHCGLGETEHPFTLEFNNKDVRITTNYDTRNVASSMYSVLHEGGHALYELGIRDDLQYTCLAGGVSMGVHESQSRFYENLVGRSRGFIEAIYPTVQQFFPEQLGGVSAEQFYRAVNKAQPSLVRTESDELTYCLHVMVRYEIEKQLIGGSQGCPGGMGEALQRISRHRRPQRPGRLPAGQPLVQRRVRLLSLLCAGQRLRCPDAPQHGAGRGCGGQHRKGRAGPHHSLAARESAPVRRAVCPGGCGQERLRHL